MSRPNAMLMAKLEAERKLKEGISGHRTGLPKKLLELFSPLEPLGGSTPMKHRKPALAYTGMGQYLTGFSQPGDEEYEPEQKPDRPDSPRRFRNPELKHQARVEQESKLEKRIRVVADKADSAKQDIEDGLQDWEPSKDPNAAGDAFKTLFVSRISFDVTEKKLRKEFEEYGPIKRIRLVHDKNTDKPKGYAFIEYEHKNDMKNAYKVADGKKLEGRRITVDVERGRTVPGWRPRRFGGGKGGEGRTPKEPKNPSKRLAAGLSLTPGLPAPPSGASALPPPPRERPREDRPPPGPPPARERERDRGLPPPPSSRDRDRPRERDERPRDGDRHRERDREFTRDKDKERPHSDRHDRDRERSDRKREREPEDGRSAKRSREDDRGTRRRERDHV